MLPAACLVVVPQLILRRFGEHRRPACRAEVARRALAHRVPPFSRFATTCVPVGGVGAASSNRVANSSGSVSLAFAVRVGRGSKRYENVPRCRRPGSLAPRFGPDSDRSAPGGPTRYARWSSTGVRRFRPRHAQFGPPLTGTAGQVEFMTLHHNARFQGAMKKSFNSTELPRPLVPRVCRSSDGPLGVALHRQLLPRTVLYQRAAGYLSARGERPRCIRAALHPV